MANSVYSKLNRETDGKHPQVNGLSLLAKKEAPVCNSVDPKGKPEASAQTQLIHHTNCLSCSPQG